jgi:hypothetical protein
LAKKAFVYDGSQWVDIAQSTADLTNYPNMTTTPISGFRNAIINGGFDIWQRGTTFSANNIYTADRWWHVNDSVGATSVDRVAADSALIPGCEYFLRMTRTSGTNRWVVGTNLETSVVKKFKGRTVILSYWLRKGSSLTADVGVALKTTSAEARFNSSVDSSTATITAAQLSTSTFTRFTQTLTIPAGSTALGLAVEFEAKSQAGAANAFLDIAMVQLEIGTIATPFEQRPIGTELALCQRYYEKSYDQATAPGTVTETGVHRHSGCGNGSGRHYVPIRFKVEKRVNSYTVTTHDPTGSGTTWVTQNPSQAGLQRTPLVENVGTSGMVLNVEDGGYSWTVGNTRGHWTVSAEL